MAKLTPAVRRAREQWRHRGVARPPFAIAPGAGQESVWDYPRPPRLAPDSRRVQVRDGDGALLADTGNAIRVLETASPPTFYLPPDDVRMQRLRASERRTFCEWKGIGIEFDLPQLAGVAWTYADVFPEFAAIAGYIGFYPSKAACSVDGEPVRPQPGGYYGGWVTNEVIGPFKGEPGSASWW